MAEPPSGLESSLDHGTEAEVTMSELQSLEMDMMRMENTVAHHTDDFQTKKLVLRRGQEFLLRLLLNQPLGAQDQLKLQFTIGPNPNAYKHTLVELNPRASDNWQGWRSSIHKESGKEVRVAVTSAPNAIIGKYNLHVKCGNRTFKFDEAFYLLFNPWCPEDSVYMPSEEERMEYVLNDTGYVYMGFYKNIRGKPWNFGQFEKHILSCCIYLLNQSYLKTTDMRNPVLVSRTVSAMMSAANKNGVLIGNWSGNYAGGMAPYMWTGSVPILQQYYLTKRPVAFGQCWVFSGILTTVLRALGIPARSVTAFESAHDTEKNLTVDIFLNELGKTIDHLTKDSVWNFHVWTDAWMKRLDLPSGHNGWQALDGTPQEISQGIFRCGPAPLAAVRRGDVFLGYDTKFLFTEVNGDKLIWLVKKVRGEEVYSIIAVETMSIGRNISTKAVGQDGRHDITHLYKYPEGSPEEREAMDRASSLLSSERERHVRVGEDSFQLSVREDTVQLGNPIVLTVILKRKTATTQSIHISGSFDLQTYTGKLMKTLGIVQKNWQVHDEESETLLTLDSSTYIGSLGMFDDEVVIKGFIIAENVESNETVAKDVSLCFLYPSFSVEMPSTGQVGRPLLCSCIFKNTLSIPLTNIKFSVESLGLSSMQTFDQGTVQPGKSVQFQIKCIPVKTGPRKFIIKFSSKQVKEVHAEKIVLITK